MSRLALNAYGYHEIVEKPTEAELADYYANKYFQSGDVGYAQAYDAEELAFIDSQLKLKLALAQPYLPAVAKQSLLDVGCGEGFTLPFFADQGWDVLGIDASSHAIAQHHPAFVDRFLAGDFRQILADFHAQRRQFSLLWLDNVLEHVIDPMQMLRLCLDLTLPGGLIMIDVPNDFSVLQQTAKERGWIDREFWVALPDHLSYFNREGLQRLAEAAGWQHCKTVSDFPIDFNLAHDSANYIADRSQGKAAHRQRIRLTNLMVQQSPEKTLALYEALADLGMGRSINAIFRKP
jgi:2-polyprenyl-3-methyl-5-hydroxy-6-metoxy-1,4-benzoquinol methylase